MSSPSADNQNWSGNPNQPQEGRLQQQYGQPQNGQVPQYGQQYGELPQYPSGPGTTMMGGQRPPIPGTVRWAVYGMFGGAVLEVIGLIIGLVTASSLKHQLEKDHFDSSAIDSAVRVAIVVLVVTAIIGGGLWLWMALANRAGRNWARITATVFFGISCIDSLVQLSGHYSSFTKVMTVVGLLYGLVIVLLMWNGKSKPYYKPQFAQY